MQKPTASKSFKNDKHCDLLEIKEGLSEFMYRFLVTLAHDAESFRLVQLLVLSCTFRSYNTTDIYACFSFNQANYIIIVNHNTHFIASCICSNVQKNFPITSKNVGVEFISAHEFSAFCNFDEFNIKITSKNEYKV